MTEKSTRKARQWCGANGGEVLQSKRGTERWHTTDQADRDGTERKRIRERTGVERKRRNAKTKRCEAETGGRHEAPARINLFKITRIF